jgi:hypothetical protein
LLHRVGLWCLKMGNTTKMDQHDCFLLFRMWNLWWPNGYRIFRQFLDKPRIYIYYIGYQWMSRISRRGKVSGPLVVPKFLLVCLISRSCLSAVMWIVGSSLWNWTK